MRERDVEKFMKAVVEGMGGLFFKFTSPGNDGVPDRIAVLPGGETWFIELKAEGGRPSKVQLWQMDKLKSMGCNVSLVVGMAGVRAWERQVMRDEVHTA